MSFLPRLTPPRSGQGSSPLALASGAVAAAVETSAAGPRAEAGVASAGAATGLVAEFRGGGMSTNSVAQLAVSGRAAPAVRAINALPASWRLALAPMSMDRNLLRNVPGRSSTPAKSGTRPEAALAIAFA